MADSKTFGEFSILETVHRGLMDFSQAIGPLLIVITLPSLITGLYQYAIFDQLQGETPAWTYILAMIPEYLIAAPFYLAMLYLISMIRHDPPPAPRDSVLAGIALFPAFIMTTLLLVAVMAVAGLVLGLLVEVQDGQLVIGLGGLIGILLMYAVLLTLSFYPHIILFEQRSGMAALKQSLGMFRVHWRRILAVLFFPVMMVLLLQNLWLHLIAGTVGTEGENPGLLVTVFTQFFSWGILGLFEGVRLALFQDLRARAIGAAPPGQ